MNRPMPLIVLEVFLGFAVPLVWAIYELIQLRRYRDADEKARRDKEQAQRAVERTE